MQELIVALVVTYAAWAVARRYAPKAMRAWVRATAVSTLRRAGFTAMADKMQTAAAAAPSCSDGCSSCDTCSSNSSAKPAAKSGSISVEQLRNTISR